MSLNRFSACTLKFSEYFLLFAFPGPPNIPPRPPPPPKGPPKPPPNPPPPWPPPPPGGRAPPGVSTLGPIPNVRPTRKLTATADGLLPSEMGMGDSPDPGARSNVPKPVCTTLLVVAGAVVYEGRSLKKLSPVRSYGDVTLYGRPACAMRNGLKVIPHGPL